MSAPQSQSPAMDPRSGEEIAHDFSPFLKIYKNGSIQRLMGCDVVPPSLDPTTNVESKDVAISKDQDISARIFIPKPNPSSSDDEKLPVLIYFHGGGFCIETPFSPPYHNFLNAVVSEARVIGVSVDYRRAPEHPLPAAYEDSWAAIKWAAAHIDGKGPEDWLNRYADFGKVFFAGDSAGANIAHHMGIRVGSEGPLPGVNLVGIALVHTYFWGVDRIGLEATRSEYSGIVESLWRFTCPTTSGSDDPMINPAKDPNLGKMGCGKMVVFIAEKDLLKDRGWYYKELLEKSGWQGVVEVMEAKGEDHVFHLFNPKSENALSLLNRMVSFIKQI